MSSLKIVLIIILVLILVTVGTTYFVRKKYYEQINFLNTKKREMYENAPFDELSEIEELNVTGQSLQIKEKLKKEWKEIQTNNYQNIENHLCGAERATDNYRLGESKKNQTKAENLIEETILQIEKLSESLNEIIEREQANLKKIDSIKKRYHKIRKTLLTHSFSYGPASDALEDELLEMENLFSTFSELTMSGDHEEANEVILNLENKMNEIENIMDKIPSLLEHVNENISEQLEDLENGYEEMRAEDYLFPNDDIMSEIQNVENDKDKLLVFIKKLKIEEAEKFIRTIDQRIDELYDKMELEINSKLKLSDLLKDCKQGLYILKEENKNVNSAVVRLGQSYILIHNENEMRQTLELELIETNKKYKETDNLLEQNNIPYSIAYETLNDLFNNLQQLNAAYEQLSNYLGEYRQKELKLKNSAHVMRDALYTMKRELQNERLPGLPDNFLELFFSTSDRVEKLIEELSKSKIDVIEIQNIHQMCEEDIKQLEQLTKDIIRNVELTERVSQRLYRYRGEHKGVMETIRYSETLFNNDFDYDTSLRLVKEKLENIAPGQYEQLVQEYEEELKNQI